MKLPEDFNPAGELVAAKPIRVVQPIVLQVTDVAWSNEGILVTLGANSYSYLSVQLVREDGTKFPGTWRLSYVGMERVPTPEGTNDDPDGRDDVYRISEDGREIPLTRDGHSG